MNTPSNLKRMIKTLAFRKAVIRHTPPLRQGESAFGYLARATKAVEASFKLYELDPGVKAEAERRLAGGVS